VGGSGAVGRGKRCTFCFPADDAKDFFHEGSLFFAGAHALDGLELEVGFPWWQKLHCMDAPVWDACACAFFAHQTVVDVDEHGVGVVFDALDKRCKESARRGRRRDEGKPGAEVSTGGLCSIECVRESAALCGRYANRCGLDRMGWGGRVPPVDVHHGGFEEALPPVAFDECHL